MKITLKKGREKTVLKYHPWIFSGAVDRVWGEPNDGDTVDLFSNDGKFLARAAYSPNSQIRARVWSFEDVEIDKNFFVDKVRRAIEKRKIMNLDKITNGYRIINSESDGLPGFIADKYGEVVVIQSLFAGSELWKNILVEILIEEISPKCVYERSDADVREIEGLPAINGLLWGDLPNQYIFFEDNGLKYLVDPIHGHKTGYYLDQRVNRYKMRDLAEGREVLDCFCYTGGFTINALLGGAKKVISIDSSVLALEQCRKHVSLNNLPYENHEILQGNVFEELRRFRDMGRQFDLIVLDPPKFAPTVSFINKASRAYKDINLLALKLLRKNGILLTFSCSGGVDLNLFQKIVSDAAFDAGVELQIIDIMSQSPDHPISVYFPEGWYLKGLVCLKG